MDIRALVGQNATRLRRALPMNQEEFAVHSGFSQSYISQIEAGGVNLTLLRLHDLAEALNVTPLDLLKPDES